MPQRGPRSRNRPSIHEQEYSVDAAIDGLISRIQSLPQPRASFSLHFFRQEAERIFAEGLAPIVEYYLQGDLGEYVGDITAKYPRPLSAASLASIFRLNDKSFAGVDIKIDVKKLGSSLMKHLSTRPSDEDKDLSRCLKIIGWIREAFQIFPKTRPRYMPYFPNSSFEDVSEKYTLKRKELRRLWADCIQYVELQVGDKGGESRDRTPAPQLQMNGGWPCQQRGSSDPFSSLPPRPMQSHPPSQPFLSFHGQPPTQGMPSMMTVRPPPPPPRRDINCSRTTSPAETWLQQQTTRHEPPTPVCITPSQSNSGAEISGALPSFFTQSFSETEEPLSHGPDIIPPFMRAPLRSTVQPSPPAAVATRQDHHLSTPRSSQLICDHVRPAFGPPSFFNSAHESQRVTTHTTTTQPPVSKSETAAQAPDPKQADSTFINGRFFIGIDDYPNNETKPTVRHVVEPHISTKYDAEDPTARLWELEKRLGALWKPSAFKEQIPGSWMD